MLERQYDRLFVKLSREMLSLVRSDIIPSLPALRTSFTREFNGNRFDDLRDDLRRIMDRFKSRFQQVAAARESEIAQIGISVNNWVRRQTRKLVTRALGADLLASEADLDRQVKLWIAENVAMMHSMSTIESARINEIILDSLRQGRPVQTIADGLQELWLSSPDRKQEWVRGVSPSIRARLVASDQVSKLHAQLTRYRQRSMGVRFYRWRTQMDNKVRHSHRVLEGQVFAWDPADGPQPPEGHPGMPPNCRCGAEPILSDAIPEMP
jgi:SPP1 gp7 family putative phage head morphogenesis protein